MRILVAEDTPTTLRMIEKKMREWGYDVVTASDGLAAWNILQGEDPPRLALLDRNMPGIDGVEICRRTRLNDATSASYLVLGTARTEQEDIVAGLDSGADDYVTKPYVWDELKARLHVGERVLALQTKLAKCILELNDALEHIKTLQGILPICMHCHRIRDDAESWQQLESYIEHHSGAEFSHSLCPECLESHYPAKAPPSRSAS